MQSLSSFSASELTGYHRNSKHYELKVIQSPEDCRALATKEKTRGAKWPLDPPPVIELILHDGDPSRSYLHSPFWFCTASLETISTHTSDKQPSGLVGTTVSSLHRVKLTDSKERGFFIFGDLNIKKTGMYRLKFSLFEMRQGQEGSQHMVAELLSATDTKQFRVHAQKTHLQTRESTQLSKQLCEAGVKLRIRKEPSNKRRATHFEWAADRSQALPSGIPSFASGPFGSSMSRTVPAQPTLPSTTPGQDVSHRLSLSNQGSLGIRNIMDDASSRRSGTSRGVDSWAPHQRTSHQTIQPTTHQPQNWSMPNWSYSTTPVSASYSNTPVSTSYSMPPATSSYELTSGRTSYNDASYSNTHHTMPSPTYNLGSINHSQQGHPGLRGSDSSYFMGSTNPFTHMQSTDPGMSGVNSRDTSNVASFDMSFSTTTSMATGGTDAFGYQNIGGGLRSFPVTSGGDASDHFV